ncbi:MAG: SHOCT domain-containing protein [Sulfurimonadaceae bacterium]
MKKLALLILVVLTFTSCSKVPFKEESALQNASLVYFYVSSYAGSSENTSNPKYMVKIDGQRVKTRVEGGEYLSFNLESKPSTFTVIRNGIIENQLKLELKEGATYYLKVVTNNTDGDFTFVEVDEAKGLREIKKTYLAGEQAEDEDTFVDQLVGDDKDDAIKSEQSDADELERLHDLKEKGAITQEEYETLKAKVINKQ